MTTFPAPRPEPKAPLDRFETAGRHLAAAKSVAAEITSEMIADMRSLAADAGRLAQLDIAHPGIREEARKLAEHLAGAADRMTKTMGAGS